MEQFHGTTILSVRRGNLVALGGDGQVTLGNLVMKGSARKVRKLFHGKVLAGFAGGTADAFTLLERFESKLEAHQGNLMRSSVELAKDWRTDRMLRRLEAMLLVADRESTLISSSVNLPSPSSASRAALASSLRALTLAERTFFSNPKMASARLAQAAATLNPLPKLYKKIPTCRPLRSSKNH